MDLDLLSCFGVNPSVEKAAAGEDERMCLAFLNNSEFKIAVKRCC